jgi:hypothetical protein
MRPTDYSYYSYLHDEYFDESVMLTCHQKILDISLIKRAT